jgi:TRAP-type mannitol/chloroaromatic compound transport system permease large subunit
MAPTLAVTMVAAVCVLLLIGYPVALTLAGVSLVFAAAGAAAGAMDLSLLGALPQRIFGIMNNEVLLAIPLFIFMGVMLERSRIAEDLLETMGGLFGRLPGGLGIAVIIVGVLIAAAKGIVGATTVTMGLIVLPTMLRQGYNRALAAGTVAATSTLAQIFPPATVLILLGDQLSDSYAAAQMAQGNFAPQTVAVADLFAGAIVPGLVLVLAYMLYLIGVAIVFPKSSPAVASLVSTKPGGIAFLRRLMAVLVAPLALILAVLGSILGGGATPTEAAPPPRGGEGRVGVAGVLVPVMTRTTEITSMIFLILIGATLFSLVFRGLGGAELVERALANLPGGVAGATLAVMLAVFLLGFVMDAFEIIFVVVPIVAPVLLKMPGVDPVWLGIMLAVNLQTSYMHPPLGPTLFYLRAVAPPEVTTRDIYLGIIPYVLIELSMLVALWFLPGLATWLPHRLYGS